MAEQQPLALTPTPKDLVAELSLAENTRYTVQFFVFGDDVLHMMEGSTSPDRGSTRGFQYENREQAIVEPKGDPIWAWAPGSTGRGLVEVVEAP
ncbi:MAG: hypothetical protein F4Y03_02575 [Alphaproteobacteria bacterium]|nr:hypothetical protein [Alphaproteobacteria bacterium]